MRVGEAYYTLAEWTVNGLRPEKCIWRNDLVDNDRLSKGKVFKSRQDADKAMRKPCTEVS